MNSVSGERGNNTMGAMSLISIRLLGFAPFLCVVAAAAAPAATPSAAPAAADCCDPEPAAIVWRLDRTDAIAGHPLTVVGAPRVEGKGADVAVVFDGAHDGLVFPVSPIAGWAQFTVEACIRPDADGQPEQRFFHIQDSATNRLLMEIRLTPDGKWALDTFLLHGKDSLPLLDRTKLHPAGSWHWVALRYDGKQMTSFVDGTQELTGAVAIAPMEPKGETSVGVRLNRVFFFKGGIREIRFHPSALAAADLAR